jgi:hypothetical protein
MQIGDERIAAEEVPSAFLCPITLDLIWIPLWQWTVKHTKGRRLQDGLHAISNQQFEFGQTCAQQRSEDYDNRVARTTVPLRKLRASLRSKVINQHTKGGQMF